MPRETDWGSHHCRPNTETSFLTRKIFILVDANIGSQPGKGTSEGFVEETGLAATETQTKEADSWGKSRV